MSDLRAHGHEYISNETLNTCIDDCNALVNALRLYYTSHSNDPTIHTILQSASNLVNRRISITKIWQIMTITREIFKVKPNPHELTGNAGMYISFVDDKKSMKINFADLVKKWCIDNPEATDIPSDEPNFENEAYDKLGFKKTQCKSSPTKIVKSLKNDSSKFKFKVKDEEVQQFKNNGMTLLERIRMKEQLNDKIKKDPKQDYNKYIKGKLEPVYNIIFQTYSTDTIMTKTFPLSKYMETIIDSLNYPINKEEVLDVLKNLQVVLKDKIKVISSPNMSVLRVSNLNRQEDIKRLKCT